MNIKILNLLLVFLFVAFNSLAQLNSYRYTLDLKKVENDQLKVELETPKIKGKATKFYMPKIIPGTYRESDYGLFVSEVTAYDKKGRKLPVSRLDTNTWEISKAKKIARLSYWVEDIFDTEKENKVYMMSATNIEENKNFVIHTPGFFGYFQNMKGYPFEINITKPDHFYGSTGLVPVSTTSDKDIYITRNYDHLVDSPIMYNEPDTTIINVNGTEVLVSVYSPNRLVTSSFLAGKFRDLLKAEAAYMGGTLPVKKYAFILYFAEPHLANPRQGALEHSYSSFFYLQERPQEEIAPLLVDIAAHEFYHIVTPLNIHSYEIANFDYNNPVYSKHLWLYEGVTEYTSDHVQVKYGLIPQQEFLNKISEKINISQTRYNDNLPFTELSAKAGGEHSAQYGNVYEKGALIAAMLDILLLEQSEGKMSLQDLILQLSHKYGQNKPFEDDELFDVIEEMTYPEVRNFLDRYVAGLESIPYEVFFAKAGIKYNKPEARQVATLGNIQWGLNGEHQLLEIADASQMNNFGKTIGFKKGDLLYKLQGKEVTLATVKSVFEEFAENTQLDEPVEVQIKRKNGEGIYEDLWLSAPAVLIDSKSKASLSLDPDASPAQMKLRTYWLVADGL